ncbi:MAG: hypothetical protein D6705_08735, partial [Deltaproteobacteria bacterium]
MSHVVVAERTEAEPGTRDAWLPPHRIRERFVRGVATLAILDGVAFVAALFDPANDVVTTLAFHVGVLVPLAVVFSIAQRSSLRVAGVLLTVFMWAVVTAALLLFSSMHAAPAAVYMVPVMVAGIVLGPVWALVVAAASLASLGGIFWLD